MKILQILAFMVVVYLLTIIITVACFATTIDRVVDGDTLIIKNPTPPKDLVQKALEKHRLHGIDAPESTPQHSKCPKEMELGLKAKQFTNDFIKNGVDVVYVDIDKYGRFLIHITKGNLNLADELVKNSLAVYYDGGTKIKNWCK
jgi:endonuclease YncB( thermonuclease family)